MTLGIGRWKIIDDAEAFKFCIQNRSVRVAHAKYVMAHPEAINAVTNRPPTFQAIYSAAWRYILRNPDEARKVMNDAYADRGDVLDDETWKILLASHSRTAITSKKSRERFLEKNGLMAYKDARQPTMFDPLK